MVTATRVLRASWSSTLKLPKAAFPARPSDNAVYLQRCTDDLYAWQTARSDAKTFVLHDGPPYANGDLHIGHALNKVLKDIICRFQVSQGKRVSYIPGWDCHGLPIEVKALQALKEQGVEGGDHERLGAVKVREAAKQLATRTVEKQMKVFKEWGIMGDWANAYRTMEKTFERRQLGVFREMVEKGLIYRQYKPVYWSPSSGTALAEAELEYDENYVSLAAYVKFPIVQASDELKKFAGVDFRNLSANIWTTTPWTLPANKAIGVHSDLEYVIIQHPDPKVGQFIIAKSRLDAIKAVIEGVTVVVHSIPGSVIAGKTFYVNPLQGQNAKPQPIIHADFVSPDSGTGLVHLAPGHGMDDYNLCMELGIPAFAPVDDQGRFTETALPDDPKRFQGLKVQGEGVRSVIDYLNELEYESLSSSHSSFILHTHQIKHKYPIDWRTKQPVIVRATEQWFANVDGIKSGAIKALKGVKFIPETGKSRLESFVQGRSGWCVSRQRAWGVPIPALYRTDTPKREAVMTGASIDHIMKVIDDRGINAWWTDAEDDAAWVLPGLQGTYVRGKDTMDVWFDSGTSWTMLPKRPGENVADVYLEGTDQHRGWFQSSLLTHIAHHSTKEEVARGIAHEASISSDEAVARVKAPFKTLITHGFTLDQEGRKMSKSLGNVISPSEIMNGSLLPPLKRKKVKGQLAPKPTDKPTYDALGPDALRLWVASSDYTKDVVIGQPVLHAVNQSLHKYRVTFKWLLGVVEDYDPSASLKSEPNLIDTIALHQLAKTAHTVHTHYAAYEFNRAIATVNAYTTRDLSAFYFETLKDRLYAGTDEDRIAAQRVLYAIFTELLRMLAPVTPLLVEEVWDFAPAWMKAHASHPAREDWTPFASPMPSETEARKLERDIAVLTAAHTAVKAAQERARTQGKLRSGLECDVRIVVPDSASSSDTQLELSPAARRLFRAEMADTLASLFVVSDVEVCAEAADRDADAAEWTVREPFELEHGVQAAVVVRPPKGCKCPRCWRCVAPRPETLCARCEGVVQGAAH